VIPLLLDSFTRFPCIRKSHAMGWEDSDGSDEEDWDANLEKQMKEREKELKRERGEDTDSEDDKPKPVAPQPTAKTKAKPVVEVYVPLADPLQEKIRRQKLVEEADAKLAEDLFAGCETNAEDEEAKAREQEEAAKKNAEEAEAARVAAEKAKKAQVTTVDAFAAVELATQADCESLVMTCCQKIQNGKAKGAGQKLLIDLIKSLEADMEINDLASLEKQINESVRLKKVSLAESRQVAEKKGSAAPTKGSKICASSAMDEMYGAGDWDDWDEEDY